MVDDVAYDIIRLFCDEIDELLGDEEKFFDTIERELASEPEPKMNTGDGAGSASYEGRKIINHIVDAVLGNAALGLYDEDVSEADIIECCEGLLSLYKAGKLFAKDVFRVNAGALKERHTDIKALCLHVSHACDLTCSYCFAGQGRFNGPAALMSLEVGKAAIDFLIANSGSRRNLEVDFFGGEPLLNFDVVKEIVKYARSREAECNKNFRFTLTTNGMGITDEVIDFANRECHNVVLSLDGRKEIHDRERRAAGSKVPDVNVKSTEGGSFEYTNVARGTGSYDIIVPKFQRLVAARTGKNSESVKVEDIPDWVTRGIDTGNTNYYMRGTFTHYNPDFTNDIFHMTELGFDELSMEPVVASSDSEFALTEEDLPILMEQYEILAKEMMGREAALKEERAKNSEYVPADGKQPFTFYHYMLDLGHGPCIYKRISGCGSGTEYFAVTPQGELYPCHQFVGEAEYLMGDIWNGILRTDVRDEFKMCNVYARPECNDCWAKLYCSGGCAANAYHATGSILGVYDYGCELFKKRIECAVMMKVAEEDL